MTEKNPAVFLQAGSHPAEDVRRMFGALVDDIAQLVNATDLRVTANGTGLKVNISGGRMFVPGTEATYQGTYFIENRGTTTLTLTPSDASLKRIDLIVARVQDAQYSGSTNAWSLQVVTGTLAASPTAPAAPANSVVLAQVSVTAGLATVTSAQITDTRPAMLPSVTDTGWVTAGAVTAVSGATVSGYSIRRVGNTVSVFITLTMTTAIATAASGNIVNTALATVTDSRFVPTSTPNAQGLSAGGSGVLVNGGILSDGTIQAWSTGPGVAISSGDTVSLSGTYVV